MSETTQTYLTRAKTFEHQGQVEEAEKAYLHAIAADPENYIPYSRLGALLVDMGRFKEAILRFSQARELNPEDPDVLFNSGLAHQMDNDFDGAIPFFEQALEKGLEKGTVYGSMAEVYEQTNRLEELDALLEKALQEAPDDVFLMFNAAKMARRQGRYQDALAFLEKASKSPDFQEISMAAHFEKGRIYDKMNNPDEAFKAFQKGNLISVRDNIPHGVDRGSFHSVLNQYRNLDLENFYKSTAPEAPVHETPVFLVGFPRSGTTLLNQILDGHPKITVLEEEPLITNTRANLIHNFKDLGASFAVLPPETWAEISKQLIWAYGEKRGKDPFSLIVDKLPLNIISVPLILKLFPKAKFIVALRHPFDCTLSCFMQNFGLNSAMINFATLDDATEIYEKTFSLWEKYLDALAPSFIYVRYEDVVKDLETEARKILDFLELEWDPRVLDYRKQAKTKTRINTPSYHQVIQPIYTEALYRWVRYEKFFKPFRKRLVPFCKTFGYDAESGNLND